MKPLVPDVTGAVRDLLFEHRANCCWTPDQGPHCHWVKGPFAHFAECGTARLIGKAISVLEEVESEEAEALALRAQAS